MTRRFWLSVVESTEQRLVIGLCGSTFRVKIGESPNLIIIDSVDSFWQIVFDLTRKNLPSEPILPGFFAL